MPGKKYYHQKFLSMRKLIDNDDEFITKSCSFLFLERVNTLLKLRR